MFNKIFTSKYTIQRYLDAPLLQERLKYLNYWYANGATQHTLRVIARLLLLIIDYLKIENKKLITISEIKRAAKKMDACLNRRYLVPYFIYTATRWVNMLGMLKHPAVKNNNFESKLLQYIDYLHKDKGASEKMVNEKSSCLKHLFKSGSNGYLLLEKLNPMIIDKILTKKRLKGAARRTIKSYASTMRAFLEYAEEEGWCQKNLSKTIVTPRVFNYELLPSGPSWDDVKRLLTTTEGNKPKDIRDRAILMFLSIYGLRSSEVSGLCLDNIDWGENIFYVKRAKNLKIQKLPLSKIVKKATIRYLKEIRPNNCSCKEIFICDEAPHRPLSNGAMYGIVNRRWKLLNATTKNLGPHSLRHACATRLINNGISLKEVSHYLGHNTLDATRTYAKIDLINLRKVADSNIEDLL